ncbi:succinate dehydrogenase assembly factor 2 [Histidinibacterium lentulum]|uniref:FAD assembly factor SdhE n=1 Tax=Histidinibacterium lentulum TaxID=2480588 RepID=A0A3N2QM91_9RHOB|nr:succinate dehydrogenase assembly factor 2 [Histidinibacterium lentulum]ROT96311.1 succinate dehydrogenase assembly factor 2 [Histidinibacterium lentulum]
MSVGEEARDVRLKRMRMRAGRRGIREMDLILAAFADREMAGMSGAELDAFERLMEQNDQDLYSWVSGQTTAPEAHAELVARIRAGL